MHLFVSFACLFVCWLAFVLDRFACSLLLQFTVLLPASLVPIIASGVISGVFLLLVIPVILCLVRKKCLSSTPPRNRGPQSESKTIISFMKNTSENVSVYTTVAMCNSSYCNTRLIFR